jgi:glycosyltransferase involved in cell wall biosynthesis
VTDAARLGNTERSGAGSGLRVLFVNNSAETFTPTHSGAIATCLHEVMRVAHGDDDVHLVTQSHPAAPYAHDNVHLVDGVGRVGSPALLRRAVRRLTGWAHVGQAGYYRAVLIVARRVAPDVLVCSNDPELAVMLRRAFPQARVVHWFHNLLVPSDRFRRRYALDRGIESVAVSSYLARSVEQVLRLQPRSVRTVHNGVDASRFTPQTQPVAGPVTIGFLGRVCVEKGPDTLLRAALILSDRGHAFRLQLAGDTNWGFSSHSPYRDEIESLVAQLRSRGVDVDATGHVERDLVPATLRRTQVHVVPSRWDEPFGLTLLEGMASGLAVVIPASGGLPEVAGRACEYFVREDPEDLADVLERLVADGPRVRALGAEARSRAESLTWASTYAGLLARDHVASEVGR